MNIHDCAHLSSYRRGGSKRQWCRRCSGFRRALPNGLWSAWMSKRRTGPPIPKSPPRESGGNG